MNSFTVEPINLSGLLRGVQVTGYWLEHVSLKAIASSKSPSQPEWDLKGDEFLGCPAQLGGSSRRSLFSFPDQLPAFLTLGSALVCLVNCLSFWYLLSVFSLLSLTGLVPPSRWEERGKSRIARQATLLCSLYYWCMLGWLLRFRCSNQCPNKILCIFMCKRW